MRFRLEYRRNGHAHKDIACYFGGPYSAVIPSMYRGYFDTIDRGNKDSFPLDTWRRYEGFTWENWYWSNTDWGWCVVVDVEPDSNEYGELAP